jgi:hypothetical protein
VLESSAAAKIGTGKLQQWNVDEQRPRRPGSFLYITMISLRASSLVLAFVLAVLGLQLLPSLWEFDRPLLTLMIGPVRSLVFYRRLCDEADSSSRAWLSARSIL